MTHLVDYALLGQTEEEATLLREHDKDEELHAFVSANANEDQRQSDCAECGDDSSGLMHNNTWRNVEPLMEQE